MDKLSISCSCVVVVSSKWKRREKCLPYREYGSGFYAVVCRDLHGDFCGHPLPPFSQKHEQDHGDSQRMSVVSSQKRDCATRTSKMTAQSHIAVIGSLLQGNPNLKYPFFPNLRNPCFHCALDYSIEFTHN